MYICLTHVWIYKCQCMGWIMATSRKIRLAKEWRNVFFPGSEIGWLNPTFPETEKIMAIILPDVHIYIYIDIVCKECGILQEIASIPKHCFCYALSVLSVSTTWLWRSMINLDNTQAWFFEERPEEITKVIEMAKSWKKTSRLWCISFVHSPRNYGVSWSGSNLVWLDSLN